MAAPEKLYYRIGEVCEKVSLRPSVLRFWESEFPQLNPSKSNTGQRLYTQRDIDLIRDIKHFLYDEKLTIQGTRKRLSQKNRIVQPAELQDPLRAVLEEVRRDLLQLQSMLYSKNIGA